MHKHLLHNNIFHQAAQLKDITDHNQAEKIDNQLLQEIQSVAKLFASVTLMPWSEKLHQSRIKLQILRHQQTHLTTRLDMTVPIAKLQQRINFDMNLPHSLYHAKKQFKAMKAEVKHNIKNAKTLRQQHLHQCELTAADAMDPTSAKIIQQIKKAEELKKTFQKLKFLRNPISTNSITRILVMTDINDNPKTCTDWTEVNMPEEITTKLLQHNRLHFGQAKGTPFTIALLDNTINFSGTTLFCQLILDGNSSYKGQMGGEIIINALQQTSLNTVPPTLTEHQFDGKIKNWPEETTTSLSHRHLGHIHAQYKTFPSTNNDEYDEIDTKRKQIRHVYLDLLNYATKRGYSYKRWKKIINFVLEKDPGHP